MNKEHPRETFRFLGQNILVAYEAGKWQAVVPRTSVSAWRIKADDRDSALRELKAAIATPEIVEKFSEQLAQMHRKKLGHFQSPRATVVLGKGSEEHRHTHCWSCTSELHYEVAFYCTSCNWMVCTSCGACGCSHSKYGSRYGRS